MSINRFRLRTLGLAVTAALGIAAMPMSAHADVTGNINVVSKYVLRGITTGVGFGTENKAAAVQGGLDYSHASGIYAGYWGSSLDYTNGDQNDNVGTGFESDLYAGYKGKVGPVSFGVGAIYYAYTAVQDSNATEIALSGGIGNATLGINYLLNDVIWGNAGDTYFNLGYTQPLPADFTLGANVMYYLYKKDGEFIKDDGSLAPAGTEDSSGFRGVSATLSHPFGKTGATMGLTIVGGGEDRFGNYQKYMPVLSLGMTF